MSPKQTTPDDRGIIGLYFERSEDAIKQTERKYGAFIKSVAFNILADREDAEECVNQALLLLWQHIPPDDPVCFKAYLTSVVRNIALDMRRKDKTKKRFSSEYRGSAEELEELLAGEEFDDQFDSMRLKEIIGRFVRALPEKERYIFVSRFYCFDSLSAVASSLKVSDSTIVRMINDIKRKLKTELEKEGFII